MKRVNLVAILAVSFSLTSFVACTSEAFTGTDASLSTTAIDEAQAATVNDQVISVADEYANAFDANGFTQKSASQAVMGVSTADTVIVTVDKPGTTAFPKKMCIDFGTTGFTDKRDNVLKGKIYITISNRMTIAGSIRKMEYSNFFINDNSVKGSKTVTYNGETAGKPSWSIVAKDTVVRTDGTTVIWNSDRTRTRSNNNGTPLIYWDDVYTITGSSAGINAKGVAYTMTIDSAKPLTTVGGFRFFVSGAVLIVSEKRTALLDYGDGTKDAKATVTIDGVTKTINLRK
ncbi:MAG: hypothetical protein PHT07_17935 [Paludibacter sp.]|nr:hypothetical protein [Paludibacter sp.]